MITHNNHDEEDDDRLHANHVGVKGYCFRYLGGLLRFVLLRLRIYRMLYVTRRPLPRASAGLGIWRTGRVCKV